MQSHCTIKKRIFAQILKKQTKWILVRVEAHIIYYKTPANQVCSFKLPGHGLLLLSCLREKN